MTDLYLDIEGNSGKITKKTDDQHKEAVRFLFDQIDILNRGNVNDKTMLTFICFSNKWIVFFNAIINNFNCFFKPNFKNFQRSW